MVGGRRIPVLIGTIALLSGCGTSRRVEVSGVVRDSATGRAISNALVVAADGTATRTDAEGRFVLTVMRDDRRMLRASAALHEDAEGTFDASVDHDEIVFELVPTEDAASDASADAVLRWLREAWLDVPGDDATTWEAHARASLDEAAFRVRLETTHGEATECASCHPSDAALITRETELAAPHAGLSDGCLACHGERSEDGVRMRSLEGDLATERCAPCHGRTSPDSIAVTTGEGRSERRRTASAARARAEAAFAERAGSIVRCGHVAEAAERIDGVVLLVDGRGFPLGDCDASGAIDGTEIAVGIEVLPSALAEAAVDLAMLRADRSHGVHQPRVSVLVAERIERSLAAH